jgi:hypothetical protein
MDAYYVLVGELAPFVAAVALVHALRCAASIQTWRQRRAASQGAPMAARQSVEA